MTLLQVIVSKYALQKIMAELSSHNSTCHLAKKNFNKMFFREYLVHQNVYDVKNRTLRVTEISNSCGDKLDVYVL